VVGVRVLVVEDHEVLARTIGTGLRREGMAVDVVGDGSEALAQLAHTRYDVVVLDRDLPLLHGDDVCRALNAEQPATKVLMLTAARALDDVVEGLALGADDYLAKPFRFAELIARLQALARRSGSARAAVLRRGDVELDPARRTAARGGRDLGLGPKEFGVLEVLLAADGAVVSAEELLARVWDENADPFTNSVRMVVMTLRRKLGDPPVVETVPGAGYRV
jgi:two-component system, OmpR family, response regulator VanR